MTDTTKPREYPPLPPMRMTITGEGAPMDGHWYVADQLHAYSDPLLDEIDRLNRDKAAAQREIDALLQNAENDELRIDELRAKLKTLEEQEPAGVFCVSYYKGIKGMADTEFQPMVDFDEGVHKLYTAAGAKS